jgi:hydroxymethylbilane synthase
MSRSKLRLGTRRSLLAWAQSSWVAREVEKLNPGVEVELVGIETQGDRIQNVSLRKIEGKEFFVAEIDQALLKKEVDFTVHSLKDLSRSPQIFEVSCDSSKGKSKRCDLIWPSSA